jgi:hypothetical protein
MEQGAQNHSQENKEVVTSKLSFLPRYHNSLQFF